MGFTALAIEGVEDFTSGLATVFEVAELVDFQAVKTGVDSSEFSKHLCEITTNILGYVDEASGVRVAKEVELAGSEDLLVRLLVAIPVVINGFGRERGNIARSNVRNASPVFGSLVLLASLVAVAGLTGVDGLLLMVATRLVTGLLELLVTGVLGLDVARLLALDVAWLFALDVVGLLVLDVTGLLALLVVSNGTAVLNGSFSPGV